MLSDIEIAHNANMQPISLIAHKLGIPDDLLEPYGKFKAKVDFRPLLSREGKKGKLILVTAVSPTPAGEGKTTVSIGLLDSLCAAGKKACAALREPSLGPVFGVKGGAAGGGYAQVIPMEDINLHFTGDIHAVTAANNLLAALLDNHIFQGNALGIDTEKIVWHRCMDMNDRQLRSLTDGIGGPKSGVPRSDAFDITAASEIMAVLCLADSYSDLRERLSRIVVGYTSDGKPVTAGMLGAAGAMTALLRDALKPNLVQTMEGNPVLIHGGPFANIAHGCNSVTATKLAMSLSDYTVTEAGFGADLGAEKFMDIKCRMASIAPSCVVLVTTVKALKYHGGAQLEKIHDEDLGALESGIPNLMRHLHTFKDVYHVPVVVAINHNACDTDAELDLLMKKCESVGAKCVLTEVFARGSEGGAQLAQAVIDECESGNCSRFDFAYPLNMSIEDKANEIAKRVYGADGVTFTPQAKEQADLLTALGFGALPLCMAKTQFSFSDDPSKLGAPEGFTVTVSSVGVSAGAGFIVAKTGKIMTMPGLPKSPAAERIDTDPNGNISGIF